MGADNVPEPLPPLLRAVQRAGHPVVWACDPMHGNTYAHESGYKTRHFDSVMHEVEQFFVAWRAAGLPSGGGEVALWGEDVAGGPGGCDGVPGAKLEGKCEKPC